MSSRKSAHWLIARSLSVGAGLLVVGCYLADEFQLDTTPVTVDDGPTGDGAGSQDAGTSGGNAGDVNPSPDPSTSAQPSSPAVSGDVPAVPVPSATDEADPDVPTDEPGDPEPTDPGPTAPAVPPTPPVGGEETEIDSPEAGTEEDSSDPSASPPAIPPEVAESCEVTDVGPALIYDGKAFDECTSDINPPRIGYWHSFSDGSRGQPQVVQKVPGELGGRDGADDCAVHAQGSQLREWGGGIELSLHEVDGEWCPYDGSKFSGVEVWLKGTTSGTYTRNYSPQSNTVRIQLKNDPDSSADHYGFFCTITSNTWTRCSALFSELEPEGWNQNSPDFDLERLVGIGFIAHTYERGPAVSYDFWIDDVSFF